MSMSYIEHFPLLPGTLPERRPRQVGSSVSAPCPGAGGPQSLVYSICLSCNPTRDTCSTVCLSRSPSTLRGTLGTLRNPPRDPEPIVPFYDVSYYTCFSMNHGRKG